MRLAATREGSVAARRAHASIRRSAVATICANVDSFLNKLEREQYISLEYYHKIGNHSHKVDKLIEPQVESKNLGNNVNSPGPDYAPVFHSGSNSLIFTSQRGRSGINNENLVENVKNEEDPGAGNLFDEEDNIEEDEVPERLGK